MPFLHHSQDPPVQPVPNLFGPKKIGILCFYFDAIATIGAMVSILSHGTSWVRS